MTDSTLMPDRKLLIDLPPEIELEIDPEQQVTAYRYFPENRSAKNFIDGNIWFSGPNLKRIYQGDPMENHYFNHTRMGAYTLSLSLLHPEDLDQNCKWNDWACIEINVNQFLNAVKADLARKKFSQKVSWLHRANVLEEIDGQIMSLLVKKKRILSQYELKNIDGELHGLYRIKSSIESIKPDFCSKDEPLCFYLYSFVGRTIDYYDPSTEIKPLSVEAVQAASSIRKQFECEKEYRIELNATFPDRGIIKEPRPNIQCMVEYIKLSCPSASQYCKQIQ